jgi:toxin ParE1/3/4
MGDLIQTSVDRLSGYPESGRPGRVAGTRELVVARTPFIVVYRVERHAVLILRVLHGKQQWPPESGRREASPSDRPPQ